MVQVNPMAAVETDGTPLSSGVLLRPIGAGDENRTRVLSLGGCDSPVIV